MLSLVGIGMLILGGILIVLSLILAMIWRVPSLIDELSGRKAKRHIERMRKLNLSTGSISLSDTAEFYKSLNKASNEVSEKPATSELGKLVDDPYGTVGKKDLRGTVVSQPAPQKVIKRKSGNAISVVILEEQSSLEGKQEVSVL